MWAFPSWFDNQSLRTVTFAVPLFIIRKSKSRLMFPASGFLWPGILGKMWLAAPQSAGPK